MRTHKQTATGTPQILINEAIHLIQIGAQVYDDKEKRKELKYGSLYATSHRYECMCVCMYVLYLVYVCMGVCMHILCMCVCTHTYI